MKNTATKEFREKIGLDNGEILAWYNKSYMYSEGVKDAIEILKYGCIKNGYKSFIASVEMKIFKKDGSSNMMILMTEFFNTKKDALDWLGNIKED